MIGKGRHVLGKKKDGSTFPIHLSISEVIEDGFHLFTGIVRDLTEVIKQERHQRQLEDAQKAEAQALIDDLAVARSKSEKLLRQMLPGDIPERIMRNEAVRRNFFGIALNNQHLKNRLNFKRYRLNRLKNARYFFQILLDSHQSHLRHLQWILSISSMTCTPILIPLLKSMVKSEMQKRLGFLGLKYPLLCSLKRRIQG